METPMPCSHCGGTLLRDYPPDQWNLETILCLNCQLKTHTCDYCYRRFGYKAVKSLEGDFCSELCVKKHSEMRASKQENMNPLQQATKFAEPNSILKTETTFPACVATKPTKTLKIQIKESMPCDKCFRDMKDWLNSQEQYTRVEFKYGSNYIVIAKLKEEK